MGLYLWDDNHYNVFKSTVGFPLDMNERCHHYLQVL